MATLLSGDSRVEVDLQTSTVLCICTLHLYFKPQVTSAYAPCTTSRTGPCLLSLVVVQGKV